MKIDLEIIAHMLAKAAEALFEKAKREQEAKAPPPEGKIKRPVGRPRKYIKTLKNRLNSRGRPKGAKNWTNEEKDIAINVWVQTASFDDVAAAVNRSRHGAEAMIYKILKAGL